MCGRFALNENPTKLAQHFHLSGDFDVLPSWNIAPSTKILTVKANEEENRLLQKMRWGLIPSWAKDPSIGNQLINARAETVATKPAFRTALRERRCLIVADGFYEWQAQGRRKQPWCIRMQDGRPFAFAGLWERWTNPEGRGIESCTIITTTPNALIKPFHHRMPVILVPRDYDLWLDVRISDLDRLLLLLAPYLPEDMTAYPVSPLVNNPANDSPACQSPTE